MDGQHQQQQQQQQQKKKTKEQKQEFSEEKLNALLESIIENNSTQLSLGGKNIPTQFFNRQMLSR